MKYLLLTTISVIIFFSICFSQTGSDSWRQQAIDSLQSKDYYTQLWALEVLTENYVPEAIPALEENIWKQRINTRRIYFLRALQSAGSSNIQTFAHAVYDSVALYDSLSFDDTLSTKVKVTQILFKIGDYSTAGCVFDLLASDTVNVDLTALVLLKDIALHVPARALDAKRELLRMAKLSDGGYFQLAIRDYVEVYGEEVTDDLIDFVNTDNDPQKRFYALMTLLEHNVPQIHNLLLDRFNSDPDYFIRSQIAEELLLNFGTVSDYNTVLNYTQTDGSQSPYILDLTGLTNYFRPKSGNNASVTLAIDTLISLKHQVASYGWLGDQAFIDELDSTLDSAKIYIYLRDSVNCQRLIKLFQNTIDEEYQDSLDGDTKTVRLPAWQFLYWNAQYILDRFQLSVTDTTKVGKISNFTITTTTEGAGKIVSGTPPVTFNLERPNPAIESGSQTFTAKENESLYLLVLPAEGYDIDTVATDGVRYSAFLRPKGGAGLQDMQLRWPVYMFENIKANHFLHARFKRSK